LTATGERQLLAIQENSVRAQVRLAQGVASEKNNNIVESLVYFQQALNADQGMNEASQRLQNFAQGSPGASIRERANWATVQKEKWEKIFNDLGDYVYNNLRIVVYDFSAISDQFDARTNKVSITVTPGVKLIFDSTVLSVWKSVLDQWEQIKNLEENKSWVNSLSLKRDVRRSAGYYAFFSADIILYDEDGIRIANARQQLEYSDAVDNNDKTSFSGSISYGKNLQIFPQNRYSNMVSYRGVSFSVPLNDITDYMTAKVTGIYYDGRTFFPSRIMSQSEYDEWAKKQ
jgi:hypothetical protein